MSYAIWFFIALVLSERALHNPNGWTIGLLMLSMYLTGWCYARAQVRDDLKKFGRWNG